MAQLLGILLLTLLLLAGWSQSFKSHYVRLGGTLPIEHPVTAPAVPPRPAPAAAPQVVVSLPTATPTPPQRAGWMDQPTSLDRTPKANVPH